MCSPVASQKARAAAAAPGAGAAGEDATGPRKAFQPYHSKAVPRQENLRPAEKPGPAEKGPVTTMMLRNIPNKYTQSTLLEEIDDMGFSGTYDFFYLPMDVQNRSNVGYAFVNFTTPAYAKRFYGMFSEHRFRKHPSRKVSNVSAAHVQGLDANLRHFENRAVAHARNDQYRPVVLRGNQRIDIDEAVAAAAAATHRGSKAMAADVRRDEEAAAAAEAARRRRAGSPQQPTHLDEQALRNARRDFEEALCGYLVSRQTSDGSGSSTASSSAGLPPSPPPGLEHIQASLGWTRQYSAPAASSQPAEILTLADVSLTEAARRGRGKCASEGGLPIQDSPAYVPLPTIPSASKIFAACHDDEPLGELLLDGLDL